MAGSLMFPAGVNVVSAIDNGGNDMGLQFAAGSLATAMLSIDEQDNAILAEQVLATPGEVAYTTEHTVKVSAENIESYDLIISGSESIGDKITGANGELGRDLPANTWGYGFGDNDVDKTELAYYGLSSGGKRLNAGADMAVVGNNVSFSKKLVFAARFSTAADSGHYKASASLYLVATPRTIGTWSTGITSGITTMQEMTSEICSQVATPMSTERNAPTLLLRDTRDNNIYTITKLADGRCWMTENLRLTGGKTLTSEDSNVEKDFTLPETLTELPNDFNGKLRLARTYYNTETYDSYGVYYNWFAATAGEILSVAADKTIDIAENAPSSVCSKGWSLPTEEQFRSLLDNADFAATPPISKPYNFVLAGYISDGDSIASVTRSQYWTSTTAEIVGENNTPHVWGLVVGSAGAFLSNNIFTGRGRSIRCVASEMSNTVEEAPETE